MVAEFCSTTFLKIWQFWCDLRGILIRLNLSEAETCRHLRVPLFLSKACFILSYFPPPKKNKICWNINKLLEFHLLISRHFRLLILFSLSSNFSFPLCGCLKPKEPKNLAGMVGASERHSWKLVTGTGRLWWRWTTGGNVQWSDSVTQRHHVVLDFSHFEGFNKSIRVCLFPRWSPCMTLVFTFYIWKAKPPTAPSRHVWLAGPHLPASNNCTTGAN